MLIGKYHGICAILFGIVFFIFTYRDKNKPSPGLTIEYSWHLGGYEAGIIAIVYGLVRFFLQLIVSLMMMIRMSEPLTKVQKMYSTTTAKSYKFVYKYEDSNTIIVQDDTFKIFLWLFDL